MFNNYTNQKVKNSIDQLAHCVNCKSSIFITKPLYIIFTKWKKKHHQLQKKNILFIIFNKTIFYLLNI